MANTIAAAFLCPLEAFIPKCETKTNGYMSGHGLIRESQQTGHNNLAEGDAGNLRFDDSNSSGSSQTHVVNSMENGCYGSHLALR